MRHFVLILLVVTTLSLRVFAQGSLSDYERAKGYDASTAKLTRFMEFSAQWQSEYQFWYRQETASGKSFRLVDAKKKSDELAFDHAALASALSKELKQHVLAEALPISNLRLAEVWYFMTPAGRCFRWSEQTKKLTGQVPSETEALQVSLSRDIPDEDLPSLPLTFVLWNRCNFEVEYFWLPRNGTATSYGKIPAHNSIPISTYSGHRWEFRGANGERLGGIQATLDRAIAVIAEQPALNLPPKTLEPNPAESPDGRYLASFRDYNLVLKELRTKKTIVVTEDGSAENPYEGPLSWSPDSKRLLFRRVEQAENHRIYFVESSPKDQLQPKLHSRFYLKPGDRIDHPRLFMLEVPKMAVSAVDESLTPQPWSFTAVHWQPDSSAVNVLYNQRGHQVLRVLRIDRRARVEVLIEESSPTFIDYAGKLSLHYLDERKAILWASERDGRNQLYLFQAKTGKLIRQLSSGPALIRRVLEVDESRGEILVEVLALNPKEDPYQRQIQRISLSSEDCQTLTSGDGDHSSVFSPTRNYLIDSYERPDLPPQRVLRDASTGEALVTLASVQMAEYEGLGLRVPERFVAPGRDGKTPIYGLIWRPSNFDPKQRYPVIESIYAGPHDQHVPKNFRLHYGEQKLAELGFIVVKCDGMGTNWRDKAFHDLCWQNLGDSGFPDRIVWMKAAATKYPAMDLSRVGIYGGSAGGQSALRALLAFGDFYKVAVSDCGCHDNRMDKIWWNELWMGWPLGRHYVEQSNVTQAKNLKGKLLLMVGELDDNVDPASTMQVVDALIAADKDFDLLVVPGAGHGTMSSAYGQRRLWDFFVRHLLQREPRWQP